MCILKKTNIIKKTSKYSADEFAYLIHKAISSDGMTTKEIKNVIETLCSISIFDEKELIYIIKKMLVFDKISFEQVEELTDYVSVLINEVEPEYKSVLKQIVDGLIHATLAKKDLQDDIVSFYNKKIEGLVKEYYLRLRNCNAKLNDLRNTLSENKVNVLK